MLQRDDFTFEVFVLCLFENRLLLVIITLVTEFVASQDPVPLNIYKNYLWI